MQHVSFVIGDERNRQLKDVQSLYKETISSTSQNKTGQNASVQLGLRNSHFNLGSNPKTSYVSEAKDQFVRLPAEDLATKAKDNKDLAKTLKEHHFTLAE